MSAFGIFALLLTTAYIIYFAVVIVRDIASGRKSGNETNQSEVFDTSFMEDMSVEVNETDGGFAVGSDEIETEIPQVSDKTDELTEQQSSSVDTTKEHLSESMSDDAEAIYEKACAPDVYWDYLQGTIDAKGILIKRSSADEPDSKGEDETLCDHY